MAQVYLGRFSRWLESLVNAKGSPVLLDISPSIVPVISTQPGNEERYLQGWNRFSFGTDTAAAAANQTGFRIRNPAGSNVIAVIERYAGWVIPTSLLSWSLSNTITTDLATTNNGNKVDRRSRVTSSTCIVSTQNTTPLITTGVTIGVSNPLASVREDYVLTVNNELTLLPGDTCDMIANTVNVNLAVILIWRERGLELSELT